MDCSGGKKTRWQRNSCPDILASIEDHVVQGTKTSWWRKPFWPCSGERTKGKKTPQHLKLCDYKSSSSPNNNQWGTRTKQKRNLDSKSSQMLLIHLLHITWQQLHQQWQLELVSGGWNWSVAGTHGGTWPPPQQKMTGRCLGQPELHSLLLQLSAGGGLSDRMEQGLFCFAHCDAIAGHPRWHQWKRKEKRSEKKVLHGPETKTKGSFCLVLPQLLSS